MTTADVEVPFPGLRPFKSSESHLFFGRDEQTEALLARLAERRLLAVVGTSGSGKSSLVRAGLIPALERGYLGPPGSRWVIAVLSRPGIGPIDGLARALAQAFQCSTAEVLAVLTESSAGLSDFAGRLLRAGEQLMVVVDQFEELFRYRRQTGDRGRVESTAFVKLLLTATGNSEVAPSFANPPVYAVLTMRSDYLGKCAQFRGLPEALNDTQYLVPRITRDQQREAIEGPIALAGAQITDRLVERILNDAGDNPDQLPVLQHVLLRVWEQSAESRARNETLDLPHYEHPAVGGISEALNRDAENAFGKLTSSVKEAIGRRMFQRLVEPGAEDEETRRPTPLSEISRICQAPETEIQAVIEVFGERGFLALTSALPGGVDLLVDISHESLIRQWNRLRVWVEEEMRSAGIYSRLADSALKHRALYRGPDLAEALRWEREESPNEDWSSRYNNDPKAWKSAENFLRLSETRQKLVHTGYVLLVAAAVALAAVFFGLYRNAKHQTRLADSRRLAAASTLNNERHLDLALLLAVEAVNTANTYEGHNALLTSVQSSPGLRAYLRHAGKVKSVAFSPDGKTLASATDGGTVQLWDVAARRRLGEPLKGRASISPKVTFSPDGKTLAFASSEELRLWDVKSRQSRGDPLTIYANDVAFSPDGKTLATGGADGTVQLWDVATLRPRSKRLKGHMYEVNSVAFSPNGKLLASGSDDGTVQLWDVAARQRLGEPLKGHANNVHSVAFSPDGKALASGDQDGIVRLWDVASVASRRPLGEWLKGHTWAVTSLAFSPDGKMLATASWDETVRLWDVALRQPLGEPLKGHAAFVTSVAFSPDGKALASGDDDGAVRLWDVAAQQPLSDDLKGHTGIVWSVSFSPDGKTLASASADGTVRLWDIAARRPRDLLKDHMTAVTSVAFSHDGNMLASASQDGTVWLWDVAARQSFGEPLGHKETGKSIASSVAFSSDGKILASASANGTVRLWDVASKRPVGEPLKGFDEEFSLGSISSVAFSPDGKTLASASPDVTVWLWNVAARQTLGKPLQGHTETGTASTGENSSSVAFSPDGRILASAGWDNTVWLWDATLRQPLGEPLKGHTQAVKSVAFSPDGKMLASASEDATVRLWDVASNQPVGEPLKGHTEAVKSVAFSRDGRTLASASADATVRLWDVDPVSWASRACARANRNLSMAEWQLYIGKDVPYRRTCPNLAIGEGAPPK